MEWQLLGYKEFPFSRVIAELLESKVLTVKQEGNTRIYAPSLDAKIAFANRGAKF